MMTCYLSTIVFGITCIAIVSDALPLKDKYEGVNGSNVRTLNFKEKARAQVNIEIRFEDREHGDEYPLDGPEKTSAHSFFPQYGGDVHFDNEGNWTKHEKTDINLIQAATHQFRLTLGLKEKKVIMIPIYVNYNPQFQNNSGDIEAIQALEGSQDQTASPVDGDEDTLDYSPDTSDVPDLCQDAALDTVTRFKNGTAFIFKGDFYWKYVCDVIADGYPRKISIGWDGLEGNLDASFSLPNGKTFFFKGRLYWRFTNARMDKGYPKLISEGFKGIPDMLDAAFVLEGNGKIYFFKGGKYWRYDSKNDLSINPSISKEYPKTMKEWKGLPMDGIDAAVSWGYNISYFFKGKKYYRFNDITYEVEKGFSKPYPRSTSLWFDC